MISLEYSNHIKTFDYKSQRSEIEREAIEKVIAGQSLFPLFENHRLTFEERKQLLKTKLEYPHKGEKSSLFLLAVVCGHVDLAKSLIEEKLVDIEEQGTVLVGVHTDDNNKACSFGYEIGEDVTPLWCAAAWCKLGLVKLLVSYGANVNHKSKVGSSPLFMACEHFHSNRTRQVLLGKPDVPHQLELVKYLVENGANVKEAGRNGNTPLTAAALSGFKDPSLVVYLLDKGADPNAKNSHGSTALHFAAAKGCLETVKELVKHGAQLQAVDAEGMTPLQRACCEGHDDVVEWIIAQADCSREQKIDALELLGASHATLIDIEDIEYPSEGQSEEENDDVDNAAIQHGFQLMLRAMKERHSQPADIPKKNVQPPLAIYNNQVESQSIEELEALSTNNEAILTEGFIIRDRVLGHLHTTEILQPLLHKAVVLAHKGDHQMAASFYSHALSFKLISSPESREILRRFLDHLAGMIESKTQLKIAKLEPAFQFILAWLANVAQKRKQQDISHFERQESEWAFDRDFLMAFYFVCILCNVDVHGDEETQKIDMIKALVNLNLQNSQGSYLFHLAVWDSVIEVHNKVSIKEIFKVPNKKVLEILLRSGANINSPDQAGNTPLHVLAAVDSALAIVPKDFKANGGKEYVDWFLQNDAKLDVENSAGEKPVDVALSEITKGFLQKL